MDDPFDSEEPRRVELTRPTPVVDLTLDDDTRFLKKIETKILTQSLGVMDDVLCFADIPLGGTEIPPEWIDELGDLKRAERRLRLAQMAQMNAKEAPVGIKVAKEVAVGIIKARATEKGEPPKLNIQVTKIDFQLPEFPRLLVEK